MYARRLADGDTLICDRGANRVFLVNQGKGLVWQYGQTGVAGSGVDLLDGPMSADVLFNASGAITNVVICDAANHRVIEVRYGDYDAKSADAGFTRSSIVWQYGQADAAGFGVDQLVTPTSVQVFTAGVSRGNMLICDQEAHRVIEVRASDYAHGFTAASVVWRFPAAGSAPLVAPGCAMGINGTDNLVWIADAGNASVPGRVLAVATNSISGSPSGHQVVADYGPSDGTPFAGSLSAPASLWQTAAGGPLVVADPGGQRILAIGATADQATATSLKLDFGLAKRKRFVSIRCTFASVPTAQFTVSYQIDGGPLQDFGGLTDINGQFGGQSVAQSSSAAKTVLFPPLTIGKTITYWITFSRGSASSALAPELQSLAITYEPWHKKSSGHGGGGASGDRPNSSGSASANPNPSSAGGGSGSGGGIGGGSGSGSGNGTGSGRGSGSTNSAGTSDTGATGKTTAGAKPPAAVSNSQGTAGKAALPVSGYAFSYAGRAGGGEGGGGSSGSGLSFAAVGGAVVGVGLLLLAGPWAARRRLRLFVNWDPNLQRPFPAERTRDMPPRF